MYSRLPQTDTAVHPGSNSNSRGHSSSSSGEQLSKCRILTMSSKRRMNLIGLCLISIVCILLLLTTNSGNHNPNPNYITEGQFSRVGARFSSANRRNSYNAAASPSEWSAKRYQLLADINREDTSSGQQQQQSQQQTQTHIRPFKRISEVLHEQRQILDAELTGFPYPDKKTLADFTPETGGQPIRSVVITTWRSGSTFLGDILNALPANFYHYEPLLDFGIVQVREEPQAAKAIRNLKHLLNCEYSAMGEYLEYGQEATYLFKHNTRLWDQCLDHPHLCWRPRFLSPFCKLFPWQSMKVVRLRLAIAARLLEDESLNVRLLLLIRDPRGTLQSRKHREWCPGRPDCDHPATLCRDMVSDYEAAEVLLRKYPDRLKVVRYEDLSLDPVQGAKDIFKFYGLPFDRTVGDFLETHTKMDYGGVSSTFRDSKSAPFHWIKDLEFGEIQAIQESCSTAMDLWGYKAIGNETMISPTFNPLLPYSL